MKALKWLDQNFERVMLVFLLAVMSCLLMYQIIMRYVFGNALAWAEELARYCFIVSAYMCIGYCIKKDLLFRIDVLFNLLPKVLRKGLDILMWTVTVAFFIYCTYYSVIVTQLAFESNTFSPALEIKTGYIYAFATLGMALAMYRSIQYLIRIIVQKPEIQREADVEEISDAKGA
ncbi:TRAP transporter small permease [Acidaminobacter hydrogenoformans]|uniref:TRAP-type C4-dicarboxylate transport system, small permease component n=1 Tax=Acidaminobacter hydrogenoformans DSM 2784 TaxID=1120920 RepID=A0A1G5S394_9FIRM|nr:TRAP transporter small permease [Acidaminobacter hydrogenoformans]SCZ80029.1 TRAP-type C4-dicarboxylate transport system, small permease component [Acidaminobacter hydrogenoformans DSM 2784]